MWAKGEKLICNKIKIKAWNDVSNRTNMYLWNMIVKQRGAKWFHIWVIKIQKECMAWTHVIKWQFSNFGFHKCRIFSGHVHCNRIIIILIVSLVILMWKQFAQNENYTFIMGFTMHEIKTSIPPNTGSGTQRRERVLKISLGVSIKQNNQRIFQI